MTQTNGVTDENGLVSDSIQNLLKNFLNEQHLKDCNISIIPGSIKGDNYLGIIAKAVVTGKDNNNEEVKHSYIIKSAPKSEKFREIVPLHCAYDREIYLYTEVLPTFEKFQKEKGIQNPFNTYAKCLQTSNVDGDEALIMDDMSQYGYRMQNRKKPLDHAHVSLVIQQLARFHAISFAIRDQKPELMTKYENDMKKNLFAEFDNTEFSKAAEMQCKKAIETLNPETDQEAIRRADTFKTNYVEDMKETLDTKPEDLKYSVVRHGDCWTNNFLFAYDDKENPKKPTNICFLDWQISHVGPPVLDLFYFLYATTDKELRDAHYEELLKEDYYETLKNFAAELGSDITVLYPYDVFRSQLKKFGRYGLAVAIMLLHLMVSESDEVPDMNTVFDNSDMEEISNAFNFESKNHKDYRIRMRDVILHIVENDYI